jgi:hypothetical protein
VRAVRRGRARVLARVLGVVDLPQGEELQARERDEEDTGDGAQARSEGARTPDRRERQRRNRVARPIANERQRRRPGTEHGEQHEERREQPCRCEPAAAGGEREHGGEADRAHRDRRVRREDGPKRTIAVDGVVQLPQRRPERESADEGQHRVRQREHRRRALAVLRGL